MTQWDIDSLTYLTRIYCEELGMPFGLKKYGKLIKTGKTVKTMIGQKGRKGKHTNVNILTTIIYDIAQSQKKR